MSNGKLMSCHSDKCIVYLLLRFIHVCLRWLWWWIYICIKNALVSSSRINNIPAATTAVAPVTWFKILIAVCVYDNRSYSSFLLWYIISSEPFASLTLVNHLNIPEFYKSDRRLSVSIIAYIGTNLKLFIFLTRKGLQSYGFSQSTLHA